MLKIRKHTNLKMREINCLNKINLMMLLNNIKKPLIGLIMVMSMMNSEFNVGEIKQLPI